MAKKPSQQMLETICGIGNHEAMSLDATSPFRLLRLLEAESDDGLTTWNFFDRSLSVQLPRRKPGLQSSRLGESSYDVTSRPAEI